MEDIKDKVDEIMDEDKDLRIEVRKYIKENIGKCVADYFKENKINQYMLENDIRSGVLNEIKSTGFHLTENLTGEIKDSIKTNTEKYVSELVRGEVYNILKTGVLREIVQESIKAILPEIIYSSLLNNTVNEIYQNREERRAHSVQDVMNIVSNRLRM